MNVSLNKRQTDIDALIRERESSTFSFKEKIIYGSLVVLGIGGTIYLATRLVKKEIAKKSDAKSFEDGSPQTIAKQIKMAFDNDGQFGTNTKALREILIRIKSKAELELIRKAYQKQFSSPMYQDMMKELQSSEYSEMLQIMEGKPDKVGGPITSKQLTAWAKRLKAAFDKTYSFIPGTDEPAIKAVFNEIPTQRVFVNVGVAYYKEYKTNILDDLKKELEPWEYPDYMKLITNKAKA